MENTRKSISEFAYASRCGKIIRDAVRSCILLPKNKYRAPSMLKLIKQIMVSDHKGDLGERKIQNGNLSILKGFEFNNNAIFYSICFVEPLIQINRNDKNATIIFPSFDPVQSLKSPNGATHYSLETICCEINFSTEKSTASIISTGKLSLSDKLSNPITNIHVLSDKSQASIFVIIAIQFYELINGKFDKMENKAFNPVRIMAIDNII